MINAKQQRFAIEYCVDFNATQAAIRAGYSPNSAGQMGHMLLKNSEILEAIEERKQELADAAGCTPEFVLSLWRQIASADPAELTRVDIDCCRHCYGYGHHYQWTEAEYAKAVEAAVTAGKPVPDGIGGFGFDPRRPPVEACPECMGRGVEVPRIMDTRRLSRGGRRLFAGVHRTKDGIKVLTRDQDAAALNLARYLGMHVDRKEISGPGGGPIVSANVTAADLTDDQLAALVAGSDADNQG